MKRNTARAQDSVANASQIVTPDRSFFVECVGRLTPKLFAQIMSGIDIVFGR